MKKGNIVELSPYRERRKKSGTDTKSEISKELQQAIKRLIQRMRKHGPYKQSRTR